MAIPFYILTHDAWERVPLHTNQSAMLSVFCVSHSDMYAVVSHSGFIVQNLGPVISLSLSVYLCSSHWTFNHFLIYLFPADSVVKNLPANARVQETWVWYLGREDPLEEYTETHSSILAWRIPWTEEPGGIQSIRLQRVRHSCVTNTSFFNLI